MSLAKLLRTSAVVAAVLAGLQLEAAADPIMYEGTLAAGVPDAGELPLDSTVSDAKKADYWMFWATAGDLVSVTTDRVDGGLDAAQWVYVGLYGDTTDADLTGGSNTFSSGAAGFIDFGDDERPPAVPGPFGDPLSTFTAPTTGWYTVAVTNFLGSGFGGDDEDYDYVVTVRGNTGSPVPEPTLLALLACGACGVAFTRRRKAA